MMFFTLILTDPSLILYADKTHCKRLIGRNGLKLSRPSACSAESKEAAKSLLEDDAVAPFDGQNMVVPSEPLLYKDMVLEDLDTG